MIIKFRLRKESDKTKPNWFRIINQLFPMMKIDHKVEIFFFHGWDY